MRQFVEFDTDSDDEAVQTGKRWKEMWLETKVG